MCIVRMQITGKACGIGYLEALSGAVTEHLGSNSSKSGGEVKLLNALTEPLTKLIVQVIKISNEAPSLKT